MITIPIWLLVGLVLMSSGFILTMIACFIIVTLLCAGVGTMFPW
jgi:hypothetical protein